MNYSPELRTVALLAYFGLEGGTVHQLAELTGCPVATLLDAELQSTGDDVTGGWFSIRTCDAPWCRDVLAPKNQGNWAYWSGVVQGYWATRPLPAEGWALAG